MKPLTQYYCMITDHKWRRPHIGEPADSRICRRCGAVRPVRKRKAKALSLI